VRVLPRLLSGWLRRAQMQARMYANHGQALPMGAVCRDPEHVRIGVDFGMSEHCGLFCQDPENGSTLEIGDSVKLNVGVIISADRGGKIRIGHRVLIGPYVVIRAANHKFDDPTTPIMHQGHTPGTVIIEDDVWIGAHAVVLANVRIGRGAVIAAGSVVSRDVPDRAVAAGAPAAVVRYRGGGGG
jgi:galactoside O-acetyltransferase